MTANATMQAFPEHRRVLDAVVVHYAADPRVRSLLLGGSNAAGTMDFYSDIDLDVVVKDASFDAVFTERDRAVEAAGPPLFRFIADHIPGGDHLFIVLYPTPLGPVKLDVEYHRAGDVVPAWWLRRRRLLLDRDGTLADVLARSAELEPPRPRTEQLRDLNQKFWTWCWYTFGKIVRGELWEAVDGLHTIRTRVLVPLIAWGVNVPQEGYRRLEQKASGHLLARLGRTVTPPERPALYAALQECIALYGELRDPVFAQVVIETDEKAEGVLRESIAAHWAAIPTREPRR